MCTYCYDLCACSSAGFLKPDGGDRYDMYGLAFMRFLHTVANEHIVRSNHYFYAF